KNIYKPKEYIQEGIYYLVNESITEEEWAQAVLTSNLKGLAIPNLQHFAADRRVKDWVITKEIDSKPILEHIIKKNSNSVLIEHWKELDHLVLSQSKLEKCSGIGTSIKNDQDQNESVAGWKERTTRNPESPFLGLKDIECLEIDLIQKQQFNNKLNPEPQSIDIIEELPIGKPYKKDASNYRRQEIESQVSQILWNSLEQNLQRKILLEKLTSWLYSETQDQKEAIREEIIRNLTRKKTEKTLYEACIGRKAKRESKSRLTEVRSKRILKERKEAPELERLEGKGAPSSNMSSQEEKRWEMDQLCLECLEKFITKG
ncbi:34333_t:CDS:2, partial [Gigaspora margarita]